MCGFFFSLCSSRAWRRSGGLSIIDSDKWVCIFAKVGSGREQSGGSVRSTPTVPLCKPALYTTNWDGFGYRIQKIKNILRFCLLLDENSVLIGCNKFGLDFFARSAIFLTVTLYSYLSIKGPSIKHACTLNCFGLFFHPPSLTTFLSMYLFLSVCVYPACLINILVY